MQVLIEKCPGCSKNINQAVDTNNQHGYFTCRKCQMTIAIPKQLDEIKNKEVKMTEEIVAVKKTKTEIKNENSEKVLKFVKDELKLDDAGCKKLCSRIYSILAK